MQTTFTETDVLTQLSEALQSRDALRLAELKRAASLSAAEIAASQTEQQRLAQKYGRGSQQAAQAATRLTALGQQQASLAADVIRASIPTPAVEDGVFVVYGRIVDDRGGGVTGAKVAAITTAGATLASSSSKSQGTFELRVPLQASKKAAKEKAQDQAEEVSVSFKLSVTTKSLDRPYAAAEILTGVPKRIAHREIQLPERSKKAQ